MESIKLNKSELSTDFTDCNELKEIIVKLEAEAQKLGKVICSVKVNGLRLSENDEIRFATTNKSEIDEIEVLLSYTDNVLVDSVQALREFLVALKTRVLTASDHFREKATSPSQHVFSEIVQSTHLLTDALLTIKPILKAKAIDEKKYQSIWAEAEAHFMKTVCELAVAYEKQDFVLVSDVLEYELLNSLDKWLEIVRSDS